MSKDEIPGSLSQRERGGERENTENYNGHTAYCKIGGLTKIR